jgi:DNA repair exonuclease SbcCD ATPase subunit
LQLLKCHIENFGKIEDLDLEFKDGINIINQPNAWGKSTLAAFIKAMFYGFETRREPGAPDRERNIYQPWQGGVYGGTLDFSVGDRSYRISRTFGKTEKSDEFHIYDLSTNLESVDFTERVGEELFDLDGLSFKRSVYIAQNDCSSRTTDAINAKLGNLAENTNDINNYESAQEALKSLLNQMSPSRATGSIKKRKNVLLEIEQELRSYAAADTAIDQLKQKKQEAQAKKEQLGECRDACAMELKLASEASRREEQRKNYLSLCEENTRKLEALVPFSDVFPMGIPDEEKLSGNLRAARQLEEQQHNLRHLEFTEAEAENFRKLSGMFHEECPQEEEITDCIEELERLGKIKEDHTRVQTQLSEREKEALDVECEPDPKIPGLTTPSILGIILAVIGVVGEVLCAVLLSFHEVSTLVVMIACAVLFFAGIILILVGIRKKLSLIREVKEVQIKWQQDQEEKQDAIEELQYQEEKQNQRIYEVNERVRAFLEKYHISCREQEFSSRLYELKNQKREYESLLKKQQSYRWTKEHSDAIREGLLSYGRSIGVEFGEDITESLSFLVTEAAKYRIAQKEAEDVQRRIADFEARTDMETMLTELPKQRDLEEINESIHSLDEQIEEIRAGIEQYGRQMDDLQEQLDLKDEKEQELAECRAEQEAEMEKYTILAKTQEYLQQAREQFIARYMAPISKAFQKYYELLLGPQQNSWMIDANISFRKKELGQMREVKWMSAGYQDLIGVCMRLALVDAMYQEEKPFLILDDPFVNLDEEKTKAGMKLLSYVAGEYQTIYFTCHSSREPS